MTGAPPGSPDAVWSAEQAAAASADYAELHAAHGGVLWVAYEPATARCGLFFWHAGRVRELTPPAFSVRSRVYEYGGGASCATGQGAAFVNEADQQIYLVSLAPDDSGGVPRALTQRPGCRYGDLSYVPAWQALVAVEEQHRADGVQHRLVRIGLDAGYAVLVAGADFYAAPVVSPDGARLAWIEWSRPQQPWIATRLCLRTQGGDVQVLAGAGGDSSLQQPRFDAAGRLWALSDREGWWQPVICDSTQQQPRPAIQAAACDHAAAPWQLGGRTFVPLPETVFLTRYEHGCGALLAVSSDASVCHETRLAEGFSRFRALAADAQHYYCIAAAAERLPAVLAIARESGQVRVLAGGARPLAEAHVPQPRPFSCTVGEGERCHGFFYAPPGGEAPPPLLVFLHGGPTSACYPVFDPRIAFWTLRGYAVLDLNYRGSSGYGRDYRLRLAGQWGELEVQDMRAAIDALGARGVIDPAQVFVRGASAGGFSALRALAEIAGLRGGASLYGVSDPLALRRVTHKFEADYLDWLIGDPQHDAARYRARTPLLHAARIRAPVIFFQGGRDAVVVPEQTQSMVAALRQRGVAVQYRLFAEERHGFRQAANQAEALHAEWAFYEGLRQARVPCIAPSMQ